MEIVSLKLYKGTTFEAELDDGRRLYLHADIISDFGVCKGMTLDREQLRRIVYASNLRRAYQYALYCLDYRDYSAEDMFEKLKKTYKSEKLCLDVVRKLAAAGLINDRRYAEKLARRLVVSRKFGYYRAKREILKKGIDPDTADEVLREYDEVFGDDLAELIEDRYSRLLTDSSDRRSIEKVKSALVRYGYGYDEIDRAVRDYLESADLDGGQTDAY
ncbi:MAG: RecX family transcriptional regulator [Ruminococcus sp.]|nr:RecX family transcriptional regulator [Ruminococcus sp.]